MDWVWYIIMIGITSTPSLREVTSIGRIARNRSARFKITPVLILMALSPFMAGAMNGTVIIIREFRFLLLLVVGLGGMILFRILRLFLSIVTLTLCFFVLIPNFLSMGICLHFLLHHVGAQVVQGGGLYVLTQIDEIRAPSCRH